MIGITITTKIPRSVCYTYIILCVRSFFWDCFCCWRWYFRSHHCRHYLYYSLFIVVNLLKNFIHNEIGRSVHHYLSFSSYSRFCSTSMWNDFYYFWNVAAKAKKNWSREKGRHRWKPHTPYANWHTLHIFVVHCFIKRQIFILIHTTSTPNVIQEKETI